MIEKLNQSNKYPISVLCHVFNVNRSSYRYWASTPEQRLLECEIKAIHTESKQTAGREVSQQSPLNVALR